MSAPALTADAPAAAPKPGASVEVPRRTGPVSGAAGALTEVPVVLPPAPVTPRAGGGLQLVPLPGPAALPQPASGVPAQ